MIFRLTHPFTAFGLSLSLILVAHTGVAYSASAARQAPATSSPSNTQPQATVDPKLDQLVKTARQTQQSGNFKLAASQWQEILEQFPGNQFAATARFESGVCYEQLKEYPLAIANLKAAIPGLTNQQPAAKLLLGYSQFQLGQQQLETANNAAGQKQASDLLVTAARTFEQLLKTNPDFPDAFQAAYFLGGTYDELDEKQAAIDAYQKMATLPNPNGLFKFESLFSIADLYSDLGQYGRAKQYFDQFLAAPETKARPDHGLVVLHAAATSIALGEAATRNGIDGEAQQHFADAEALLKTIVVPTSNDQQAILLARDAEPQLAFCYRQLGKFQAAAETYAAVFDKIDATDPVAFKTQTAIDAGLSYLEAGDTANGERFLKLATTIEGPTSAKAAHLLANVYLKQRRFDDAYDLSTQFIPIAQPPYLVPLKLNQAEAAIEIDGKLQPAIALFQSIVTDYPDHELAAAALYNVAFGQVKNGQFESAVTTADKFLQRYPNHRFLADVLEVKGNALSLSGKYSAAEQVFQQLIDDPSQINNPKRSNWILSDAMAKFQQENFAGTIALLQTSIESISQSAKAARALYLLGVSHYKLEQYSDATKSLTAALTVDSESELADESQFYLGLSLLRQNKFEVAEQTIEGLATRSPKSPFLNEAYIQLGNDRYQADQQQAAIKWFQKVIDVTEATPNEKVNAINGAAWAHLKARNYDEAQRLFGQVIESYPTSDLVAAAKTGLANAQELAGVEPSAVAGSPSASLPNTSLPNTTLPAKTEPGRIEDPISPPKIAEGTDVPATKLLRETGLAQVKNKDWAGAVRTFDKLVQTSPDSDMADADLHELAWAYRSLGREDQALLYFGEIAANKPNSRFATEANYLLGKAAYDEQRYGDAAKFFSACVGEDLDAKLATGIDATVREKAAYKQGWAFYKQDMFPGANEAFERQTKLFPAGKLLADGKFMAAESLFRNRQFGPALAAYRVAKPVVDRSDVVEEDLKWLTILHGAQAANRQQDFQMTIDWTRGVANFNDDESLSDKSFKQDIFLEIGKAYNGLQDSTNAIKSWELAKTSISKTGAEATCLIGNQLLKEEKFDEAEREFKKVFFGFGGTEAKPDIRPWQAYARFEAARSNFLRAQKTGDSQTKQAYLKIAVKHFQSLVIDYPNDKLAAKAKQELAKLKLEL